MRFFPEKERIFFCISILLPRLYRLLVKLALEVVECSYGLFYSTQCSGAFHNSSVLVRHQFREPVCFKFVNTGFDIDLNEVLYERYLFGSLLPGE